MTLASLPSMSLTDIQGLAGHKSSHQVFGTRSYFQINYLLAYMEIAPFKCLKIRSTVPRMLD